MKELDKEVVKKLFHNIVELLNLKDKFSWSTEFSKNDSFSLRAILSLRFDEKYILCCIDQYADLRINADICLEDGTILAELEAGSSYQDIEIFYLGKINFLRDALKS